MKVYVFILTIMLICSVGLVAQQPNVSLGKVNSTILVNDKEFPSSIEVSLNKDGILDFWLYQNEFSLKEKISINLEDKTLFIKVIKDYLNNKEKIKSVGVGSIEKVLFITIANGEIFKSQVDLVFANGNTDGFKNDFIMMIFYNGKFSNLGFYLNKIETEKLLKILTNDGKIEKEYEDLQFQNNI